MDSEYGGIRIGVVTELMAHTSDGKSAFMRQCAEGAARAGCGVLWFVVEDPADATAERQFSGPAGIGTTTIGRLDLDDKQLGSIDRVVKEASPWARRILPLFEDHSVESVLRTISETTTIGGAPLRAVFVDYAQILASSKNLEDEIATLGKGLHLMSRDRKFATMIGSQVATPVLTRGREAWVRSRDITQIRPSLGDTEWCRRLEKSSKAVWSLFRPARWMREFGESVDDDYAELHVIKANFGPMGWVRLGWEGQYSRFTD